VTDIRAWNRQIIDEFHANTGRVGGRFEGTPMLLLHTRGARSGEARVNPMVYQAVDGGYAVFASYAGGPRNPAWYHNLLTDPDIRIEIGADTIRVTPRVLDGAERDRIWTRQKQDYPVFAEYEAKTERTIPVILLEPVS
jgi:deazaflavin-dependent oxidoreductase (nitroreductase family)